MGQLTAICFPTGVSLWMLSFGADGVYGSGVADMVALSGSTVDVFPWGWASDVWAEVQYLDQTGGTEGKGAQQPRVGDDDDDDE